MVSKASLSIEKFKHILYSCYDSSTAYEATKKIWSKENRFLGQCVVTALLVQEYFGGDIKRGYIPEMNMSHYWNYIDSKKVVLTIEQMGDISDVKIKDITTKSRNNLLENDSISTRYFLLKERVEKRIKEWESLEKKMSLCRKCNMPSYFEHDSVHFGSNCDLLFVGEAPAKNGWRVTGRAWYNPSGNLVPSGKVFAKLLEIIDISEVSDITFLEAVQCYPLEGKVRSEHIKNCQPLLREQIYLLDPLVIIPMGVKATKALLNFTNFSDVVGKFSSVRIKGNDYNVFPMYHPSPISPKSLKDNIVVFENLKRYLLEIEDEKRKVVL